MLIAWRNGKAMLCATICQTCYLFSERNFIIYTSHHQFQRELQMYLLCFLFGLRHTFVGVVLLDFIGFVLSTLGSA